MEPTRVDIEQPDALSRLTAAEERVARDMVAAVRGRLDWLLRVPDWAGLCDAGMAVLGLPGRRQGIGLEAAVGALALENKFQLVRRVLEHHQKHLSSALGRRIAAMAGLAPFSELDLEDVLSARQWQAVRESLLFRLGQDYRHYKHAQQVLFTGYRPLVDHAVAQIVFRPSHRADCRQEGCLGLLQAIDRVDSTARSFAPFALCWIRRRVRNYLMQQRLPVYAPVNLIARASGPAAGEAPGTGEQAGSPADPQAARLEVLLRECLRHPAIALDEPVGPEGGTIAEVVSDPATETPDAVAARRDVHDLVRRVVGVLTPKQRAVIERRFGLGGAAASTLSEIARAAGISHQQAGMRERRALDRLEAALAPLVAELIDGH
jgi:RNA polymerase nonessential primary-like sigma factor